MVIKASQIFNAIPMGRLLAGIEGTHINDILKFYIKDFIHMVHPVQSEAECNVILQKHLDVLNYGFLEIWNFNCFKFI